MSFFYKFTCMKKFAFISTVLSLSAALFAAEPVCLGNVQATGFSDESKASITQLFGLYLENQGNYHIADSNCQGKATLNVSKLGKSTIVFAKLEDQSGAMLWSGQQKATSEEDLDEALQKLAIEFGSTTRKSVYASASQPAKTVTVYTAPSKVHKEGAKAAAVEPIVAPRKPRDINVYFGLGLGLTKFIGDEMNDFTDHEPLSMFDFFAAYDAKNLITMVNLDVSYKTITINNKIPSDHYTYHNELTTTYVGFGISFYYPLLSGPFTPYVGLGMAATDFEIDQDDSYTDPYSSNGLQTHVGGGVMLNRGKRISMWVHGEYFFNTYEPIDHTFHGFSLCMKVSFGV